jgi:hypothetical protein
VVTGAGEAAADCDDDEDWPPDEPWSEVDAWFDVEAWLADELAAEPEVAALGVVIRTLRAALSTVAAAAPAEPAEGEAAAEAILVGAVPARRADAANAGSCPEASWAKIVTQAPTNRARVSATAPRRIRFTRRRRARMRDRAMRRASSRETGGAWLGMGGGCASCIATQHHHRM